MIIGRFFTSNKGTWDYQIYKETNSERSKLKPNLNVRMQFYFLQT